MKGDDNQLREELIINGDPIFLRWQKLLKYYSACISAENASEITLFSSKEGTDFLQVPVMDQEWIVSGKEKLEFVEQTDAIRLFVNSTKHTRGSACYFYGFPCFIKVAEIVNCPQLRRIVQPLLIFGVDLVKTESGYAFVLQPDRPRVNTAFLHDKALLTSLEERKQIIDEVLASWDDKIDRIQNLKKILNIFARLLPEEIKFSADILDGKTAALDGENCVIPLGIIFKSTDSKYTAGLEQELNDLRKTNPNDIWRFIIDRNDLEVKEEQDTDFLEITDLNNEQRVAVKSAFSNKVSVITGPPGTGKSQVVLNIIANALLKGQSVLFGSKNHKAVDVVVDRLLQLQEEPVILKYGQKEREIEFAESLLAAVERVSNYDNIKLGENLEYKNDLEIIRKDEKETEQILLRILDKRNRISRMDAILEAIKEELPAAISKEINTYEKLNINQKFFTKLKSLENLIAKIDGTPDIISRFLSLIGLTLEKRALNTATSLRALVPLQNITVSLDSIGDCRDFLIIARLISKLSTNQGELFKVLREKEKEEKIEVLRDRIAKNKQRIIEVSVKYVDSLMRRRLMTLDTKVRRDVADYLSIIRRLDSDVTGGSMAETLRNERKRIFKSVVKVFPAIAVTNLSVRHALPLSANIVDIAIIDEASQCDIASAIPLLYRAKRAVIVGDPKQLAHISPLSRTDDQHLQNQIGLTLADDQRFLYSINSPFDLARTISLLKGASFINLREHYRSRVEIIGFSNSKFYNNQLDVWTDYRKLHGADYPEALIWHNVIGEVIRPTAGSAYNLEEAEAVVTVIEDIIKRIEGQGNNYFVSLGVVTPFREQANKIRKIATQKISSEWLQKLDLTIDTAHKYQGDERDVMIFSPVVSRKVQQRTLGFLGNTINLFNVAITRARAELHVVGDKAACAQCGIPHLSEFVKYVDNMESESRKSGGNNFESPWEKILYDALIKEGIKAIPQYSLNQYRLDLAIPDSKTPIDIEIDGEMWHRDIDGGRLLYDLKRDQNLIMHGWQVKRFWVYQLKNNLNQCVRDIKLLIDAK